MLSRLCTATFFCIMKYNDVSNKILQLPFSIAFSFGKKYNSSGGAAGAGITLRFKITTTINTKTDMPVTKRNINLSEKFISIGRFDFSQLFGYLHFNFIIQAGNIGCGCAGVVTSDPSLLIDEH